MLSSKRKRDADVSSLEQVSVLFIPFDAAGKFYKKNAEVGVKGLRVFKDREGKLHDQGPSAGATPETAGLLVAPAVGQFVPKQHMREHVERIVQQEVRLVTGLSSSVRSPESKRRRVEEERASRGAPPLTPAQLGRLDAVVRGDKYLPDLLFLSERQMEKEEAFPERIDSGVEGMHYIKKDALDKEAVSDILPVNEMAVYLREDMDKRINHPADGDDALLFDVKRLSRKTPQKDEHMLKVTVGRKAGHSLTVAGVHLRATLTGGSEKVHAAERESLQTFAEEEGIQLMIGDFNMDLQPSGAGGRGLYFDGSAEHRPVFVGSETPGPFGVSSTQQFSNSVGNRHYMGYYQADLDHLDLVGLGAYGQDGASLSRSLKKEKTFYSDHPAIHVRLQSNRLTDVAAEELAQRRAKRSAERKAQRLLRDAMRRRRSQQD